VGGDRTGGVLRLGQRADLVGAHFIQQHEVSAATAGVLLAVGAATFFASSLGSARLIRRGSCRTVVMCSGLGMAVGIAVQFGLPVSTEVSLASVALVSRVAESGESLVA
jgi:hypothetical protein